MSDIPVVVVVNEPEPEPTAVPIVEPEPIVEVAMAEQIGSLTARVQYIEDLISLHSHEELTNRSDLQECEERICSRIDSIAPVPVPEPEPIDIPLKVPPSEPVQTEPEETPDTPPKSRKQRRSFADLYYGRK